jgi:SnoaL-like protein
VDARCSVRRDRRGRRPPSSLGRQGRAASQRRRRDPVDHDAWQTKQGDFGDVPLADDFAFRGPVASFDSADGYRAMAAEAGPTVTSFEVRRQFVDGNLVCSIIDWEMAIPDLGRMTSVELLEVEDGVIVRGELIYDAENLERAMAQQPA